MYGASHDPQDFLSRRVKLLLERIAQAFSGVSTGAVENRAGQFPRAKVFLPDGSGLMVSLDAHVPECLYQVMRVPAGDIRCGGRGLDTIPDDGTADKLTTAGVLWLLVHCGAGTGEQPRGRIPAGRARSGLPFTSPSPLQGTAPPRG